jgi:hypothetical protein
MLYQTMGLLRCKLFFAGGWKAGELRFISGTGLKQKFYYPNHGMFLAGYCKLHAAFLRSICRTNKRWPLRPGFA